MVGVVVCQYLEGHKALNLTTMVPLNTVVCATTYFIIIVLYPALPPAICGMIAYAHLIQLFLPTLSHNSAAHWVVTSVDLCCETSWLCTKCADQFLIMGKIAEAITVLYLCNVKSSVATRLNHATFFLL